MTAPAIATVSVADSEMRPSKASTPPRMTAISPGNRKPMKAEASRAGSRNTTLRATQPCSERMRSATVSTNRRPPLWLWLGRSQIPLVKPFRRDQYCAVTLAAAGSRSGERGLARDRLAEHERVDLAGALVGEHRLEVVGVPDHRVLERHPVGPQDGAGLARDRQGLAHVVELAEADLLRGERARVLHASEVQREQQPLVQLQQHVDELGLGELEGGDRPVELHPGAGVVQRGGEAGAG